MTLDPDAEKVIALIEQANRPSPQSLSLSGARDMFLGACTALGGSGPDLFNIQDVQALAPGGHSIGLRMYRPTDGTNLDVCVYFHGGGWVLGDLETHDTLCRNLALATGGLVIAVDYRLAPEHPFPAGIDDAEAALSWVQANVSGFDGNPDRISVAGDSAGGNLAAVVALSAKNNGWPPLRAQILIYPATDFSRDWPSYSDLAEQKPLTHATMEWFGLQYMPEGADRRDWRASPLLAPDHKGLPPALVVTGGYDVLRDEGAAYVAQLRASSVPVDHIHLAGQIHGFITMGMIIRDAQTITTKIAQFIARHP